MEYQNTIVIYEAVAQLTHQMLLAAKQQDWDKLTELERRCLQYVEKLQTDEDSASLSSELYERKLASVMRILADDREIRNLVSPWMSRLNLLMGSNQMGIN